MKYLYIIVALVLIPSAFSISEDIWEVDYIKFYDDEGVRLRGADENGGDIELLPGDTLEMRINIENKHETHDMEIQNIKAWIKDIDDGDDLEEEDDNIDINSDDSDIIKFEFTIPNDAEDDSYDLRLEIENRLPNSTVIETFTEKWDIELVLEKRTQEFETYMLDIISNVSDMCNSIDIEDKLSACIDKAALEGQVTSLVEQTESYKKDRDECLATRTVEAEGCPATRSGLQSDVTNLNKEITRLSGDITTRDSKITGFNREIEQKNLEVKQAESKKTTNIIIGFVLGVIGVFVYKKYLKKGDNPLGDVGGNTGGIF